MIISMNKWLRTWIIIDEGGSIFTGALYNHYSAPPGFCFDVTCNDAPIIDNDKSPEYNVPDKVTRSLIKPLNDCHVQTKRVDHTWLAFYLYSIDSEFNGFDMIDFKCYGIQFNSLIKKWQFLQFLIYIISNLFFLHWTDRRSDWIRQEASRTFQHRSDHVHHGRRLQLHERQHGVQKHRQNDQSSQRHGCRRPHVLFDTVVLRQSDERSWSHLAHQGRRFLPLQQRSSRLLDRLLHVETHV